MKAILFGVGLILLSLSAVLSADTYDERTLVRISVPTEADKSFIQTSHIDVVNAGPGWAKALLRPEEFSLLANRKLNVEVLTEEMEQDRALWREADEAALNRIPTSYYTASHFDVVHPPAGSLMEHLLALHNAHPDITRLFDIGDTASGNYDIIAMEVSANPDVEENEPKIRIYGNIHGDEKSALMVPVDVLDWILANYPSNPDAVKLVEKSEMWFIPMGNPDGNHNNSRYNAHNIDLNRNFWGPAGNSEGDPFSEPETQAIRDLTEVRGKRFTSSISFHAGATCFNAVYNYISTPTTDEPIFFSSRSGGPQGEATPSPFGLAKAYQNGCTTSGFWFTNGADWYITYGDTNDWSYAAWADIDTTLELTLTKTPAPSSIPTFCAEHRQATLNYMLASFQGISGRMTDATTGAPLDGAVSVTATASIYISVPHSYMAVLTDPDVGDFHRVLQPATYSVQCSAPGYETTVADGVVVNPGATTVVDCPMGTTCAPPSILTQPLSQMVIQDQSVILTVSSSGPGPFTYQWYVGASGDTSNPIAGANSSSYTTPPIADTTSYWVRVTNGCGTADSVAAILSICSPPSIATQPASQTIPRDQTATLSVSANGDAPLSYQWYRGASGNTSNPITDATTDSFTTPPLTITTSYWVRVTNGCSSANSNTATISVCTLPSINTQPADQTITIDHSATLSVGATGVGPFTYQWFEGLSGDSENPVAGATAATFTTPPLSGQASYWARVTNNCGSSDSNAATITVEIACAFFCDDFEDSDDSGWTLSGGAWDASTPDLTATTTKSAFALSPAFIAPSARTVEANVKIATAGSRISLFGWYASKKDNVELRLMQDRGKILLKQKLGGRGRKSKVLFPLNASQNYDVRLTYDGIQILVFLDGGASPVLTLTPLGAPSGSVAFQVKAMHHHPAIGNLSDIAVN